VLVCIFGCSSQPVTNEPKRLVTKVEPNSNGIQVTKIVLNPITKNPLDQLCKFGFAIEQKSNVANLQIEGVETRRIQSIDLPAIEASIGEVVQRSNVWHGQILKWRDIQQHRIPHQGLLVAKSGIPHFIDTGFLSLLARSWILQREDGLFVYLQLLPSWHIPSRQSVIAGRSTEPAQSKLFSELGLESLLRDGEAIILAVDMNQEEHVSGPIDEGPAPVRLGEAMLGISVEKNKVVLLVIEANILLRE
jgi:hypothetical protein